MEIQFVYQKKRRDFGRHVSLQDHPAEVLDTIDPDETLGQDYIEKALSHELVQAYCDVSEHEANTVIKQYKNSGMNHVEGGWPKEIDSTEPEQLARFRKKEEKKEDYTMAVKQIGSIAEQYMRQNNSIDIYQEYFDNIQADHSGETPSARTLTIFRDPVEAFRRPVTCICWHPQDGKKLAVSYAVLRFQQMKDDMPATAYIWDISNPNFPEMELTPPSPVLNLQHNPKDPNIICGGCYNGQVAVWDTRVGSAPTNTSSIEKSHHDPVYKCAWIQSKTGSEFATISSDGRVFWWDTRKHIVEPTEILDLDCKGDGTLFGGVSLEYGSAGGATKFLAGTEQGAVLSCSRKGKTQAEKVPMTFSGHHGPIVALERHPFISKYFLTVGDWCAKVWSDDIRFPIISTKYHQSLLTDGCWSPTRAGVFFTTKDDGTLDVWDYFFKQNDPILSIQVTNFSLQTLCVHSEGKLVSAGDSRGSVMLLEMSDGVSQLQSNEKAAVMQMFDREKAREKNLDQLRKEIRIREARRRQEANEDTTTAGTVTEDDLKEIEESFYKQVLEEDNEAP